MKNRPVGITILSIISFIIGGLSILLGIGIMTLSGFLIAMLRIPPIGFLISSIVAIIGIGIIIIGILGILVGWGLLRGKNWARIISIIASIISFVIGIFLLITPGYGFGILNILASTIIIYYLTRDHVREYFYGINQV